ncbi:hypothetical protein Ate02nite_36250 [Paractinoplanes tereljensis]|uniref:Uncharacterized protein n=1 Tax=Paractinoplanes tereljensis TaxID=571912 RepID=A0A919NMK7_9ACTN|nr:hypothetical protein Ate02nite_36250 [Actinoplanes tereljensis]
MPHGTGAGCSGTIVRVEAWPEVDEHIVQHRIIPGLQVIRSARGCGIPPALEEFAERYRWLRENQPDDFTVSHESYWTGFYS